MPSNPIPPGEAHGLESRMLELERRLAAQQEILDERLLRVENNRLFTAWRELTARIAGPWIANWKWGDGPRQRTDAEYGIWVAHEQAALPSIEQCRAAISAWTYRPRVSVIHKGAIEDQVYGDWESADLESASGEYLLFVEEGAALSPLALYYIVEALQESRFDVVYSDHDTIDSGGRRTDPAFKPGWSPDLLLSRMYIGPVVAVRREWFVNSGGFRPGQGSASLHDLLPRAAESHLSVHHIARVLFHVRSNAPAAAERAIATPASGPQDLAVVICSRSPVLISSCLESIRATARQTVREILVIAHEDTGINRALRDAIARGGATAIPYTGAFNFALMNNAGAAAAQSPYLLFLNDDVRAALPGWAAVLRQHVAGERVGIAGATLWYPDRTLQHAGIVTGIGDGAGHIGRHMRSSSLWHWLLVTRNVSAVTGACLAIQRSVFLELGGFDASFPNNYNDVDLCLRAQTAGYDIVCAAVPGLVHAECRTRKGLIRFDERYRFYTRWGGVLSRPDPYYNPSLAPAEEIALNLDGSVPTAQSIR